MCINYRGKYVKYLLILTMLIAMQVYSKTPQEILRQEGFSLVTKESGKEVYYRPKEVKKFDGIVYYSNTTFFTNGSEKYSLRSDYMALACKERRILKVGVHTVPYIGRSSYKDLTKKGIKDSDFKQLTTLDKRMYAKLCK